MQSIERKGSFGLCWGSIFGGNENLVGLRQLQGVDDAMTMDLVIDLATGGYITIEEYLDKSLGDGNRGHLNKLAVYAPFIHIDTAGELMPTSSFTALLGQVGSGFTIVSSEVVDGKVTLRVQLSFMSSLIDPSDVVKVAVFATDGILATIL